MVSVFRTVGVSAKDKPTANQRAIDLGYNYPATRGWIPAYAEQVRRRRRMGQLSLPGESGTLVLWQHWIGRNVRQWKASPER